MAKILNDNDIRQLIVRSQPAASVALYHLKKAKDAGASVRVYLGDKNALSAALYMQTVIENVEAAYILLNETTTSSDTTEAIPAK